MPLPFARTPVPEADERAPESPLDGASAEDWVTARSFVGQGLRLTPQDEELYVQRGRELAGALTQVAAAMRTQVDVMAGAVGAAARAIAFDGGNCKSDGRRSAELDRLLAARERGEGEVAKRTATFDEQEKSLGELCPPSGDPAMLGSAVMALAGLVSGLVFMTSAGPLFAGTFAQAFGNNLAQALALGCGAMIGVLLAAFAALEMWTRASTRALVALACAEAACCVAFAYFRGRHQGAGLVQQNSLASQLLSQQGFAATAMMCAVELLVVVGLAFAAGSIANRLRAFDEYARREDGLVRAGDAVARAQAELTGIELQIGENDEYLSRRDEAAAIGEKLRDTVRALMLHGIETQVQANRDLVEGISAAKVGA